MNETPPHVMALFRDELGERIGELDRGLLRLEECSSDSERSTILESLLREAHSLKGAAGSVGETSIATHCHDLEDLLAATRDDRAPLESGLFDALFERIDVLRGAARQFDERQLAPRGELPRASEGSVRVHADKLDRLLRDSGELLVANHHAAERLDDAHAIADMLRRLHADVSSRHRGNGHAKGWAKSVREIERSLSRFSTTLSEGQALVGRATARVDAEVRRMRMVPFATACDGLDRIVRDAARALEKRVQLRIEGGEVDVDRTMAQSLRDPLAHLVRNAVDHGIESPEQRRAKDKPEIGTITIRVAVRGGGIEVLVADDGAGFDVEKLRSRAAERGFAMDAHDETSMMFLPGVSTAETVTGLSGRGVGLDAVRRSLDALRGTIRLAPDFGQGAQFIIALPLTLTTLRVLLFELAGQIFAIDSSMVERVSHMERVQLGSVEGRAVIMSGDSPIPLVPMHAIFDLPAPESDENLPVVIVNSVGRSVGLSVDVLIDEREIVVRSLGPRLADAPAITGAGILRDGSLVLIARSGFVAERALALTHSWRALIRQKQTEIRRPRILLVDDSVTTRTLECSILESAGFEVIASADGVEASGILARTDIDLIVSDVDMPKMDGFALAEMVRSSPKLQDIPVILVTARESDEDKRRGLEAGAEAYIVKSSFDQRELLDAIRALL